MKASLIRPVGLHASTLVYVLAIAKPKKNLVSVLISKSKMHYRRNQGRKSNMTPNILLPNVTGNWFITQDETD